MREYAVVKFPKEDDKVALVPTSWLLPCETLCLWPPGSSATVEDAVKAHKNPSSTWLVCPVVVMTKCRGYRRGLRKLKLAMDTSDLETNGPTQSEGSDNEGGRENCSQDQPTLLDAYDDNDSPPSPKRCAPLPPPPAINIYEESPVVPPTVAAQQSRADGGSSTSNTVGHSARSGEKEVQNCGCGMAGLQAKCLKVLLENRMLLRELTQRVASLENRATPHQTMDSPQAEEVALLLEKPISSEEELSYVDGVLQEKSAKMALKNRLALLGGGDLKEVVKIIMDRVLLNNMQAEFSIEGRRGKRAFKNCTLFGVIVAAVQQRLAKMNIQATDTEVQGRIGKYLAGSCDRDGGRKRRMTKE